MLIMVFNEIDVVTLFFFFQAEDGIRDTSVTGVQTCALPICVGVANGEKIELVMKDGTRLAGWYLKPVEVSGASTILHHPPQPAQPAPALLRSEERRVGKEWRSRWAPKH